MKGFNVLHPMGWDAFGLPAENAAITEKKHPKEWTYKNIETMKKQLLRMGLSLDWDREIATCHPDYYKHEQKFFIDLFNAGLAYKKESEVNWDPADKTVLANEQVIDGRGWRSNAIVERKKLSQWFFNISKFSDELLYGLDELIGWPNRVKLMQKNWIGKSVGCEINFQINKSKDQIKIFTTRPDTIFGASFIAISVDHEICKNFDKNQDFEKFKDECSKIGTTEEALANAEKLGCPSGAEAKPYKYKDEWLYVSSCIKPSFEEFSDFIVYYIRYRAGRTLFDSEIKLSYNKHINKTVPDSYYVVKNTLEIDYEKEIKAHQKGKRKKEIQSMVLRMMYDQADKQEGESILPENSTNESDSSSQYAEYELGNCQQIGDIYSECTKYVNDAPVSVIFCVYDVCREEY